MKHLCVALFLISTVSPHAFAVGFDPGSPVLKTGPGCEDKAVVQAVKEVTDFSGALPKGSPGQPRSTFTIGTRILNAHRLSTMDRHAQMRTTLTPGATGTSTRATIFVPKPIPGAITGKIHAKLGPSAWSPLFGKTPGKFNVFATVCTYEIRGESDPVHLDRKHVMGAQLTTDGGDNTFTYEFDTTGESTHTIYALVMWSSFVDPSAIATEQRTAAELTAGPSVGVLQYFDRSPSAAPFPAVPPKQMGDPAKAGQAVADIANRTFWTTPIDETPINDKCAGLRGKPYLRNCVYDSLAKRYGEAHVIDCSYFAWMVYREAGVPIPYVRTALGDVDGKNLPGIRAGTDRDWSYVGSGTVDDIGKAKAKVGDSLLFGKSSGDMGHIGIVVKVDSDGAISEMTDWGGSSGHNGVSQHRSKTGIKNFMTYKNTYQIYWVIRPKVFSL